MYKNVLTNKLINDIITHIYYFLLGGMNSEKAYGKFYYSCNFIGVSNGG